MISLENEIKELAKLLGVSNEEAQKRALKEGIKDLRLKKSIELYSIDEIGVKQAVRIAGISLAEWFMIAKEKGLLVQIKPEEIDEELKALE
jgi:predicted HTH domain antitoxin